MEVFPGSVGSEKVAVHEEKGGGILLLYPRVREPTGSKERSQETPTLIFKRRETSTAEATRAEEQEGLATHKPESEATRTTETRQREENKETDKSEIVLDDPTESPDDDRREPKAPATMGLTGGTTPARPKEQQELEERMKTIT